MPISMNPIEWLEQNEHGFSDLPEPDRQAILHFTLLWSLFEAKALETCASAHTIIALVHEWDSQHHLQPEPFTESLEYFRQRYFAYGNPTPYFEGLHLRENDNPELVRAVLKQDNHNVVDCVAALLIVIYRLRNNLFHGIKWADGIRGQINNFTHANTVLMNALTLAGVT